MSTPPKPTRSVKPTVPDHPDREYHEALMAQIGTLALTIGMAAARKSKYGAALVLAEGLVALLRNRK